MTVIVAYLVELNENRDKSTQSCNRKNLYGGRRLALFAAMLDAEDEEPA